MEVIDKNIIQMRRLTLIKSSFLLLIHLTEIMEGDILVTEPLRNVLKAGKSRTRRDIVSDMVKRWPDGVVPYTLDSSLSKCSFRILYLD